jgi:hypothetical protein
MAATSAIFGVFLALSQAMPVLSVDDPAACLDRDALAREVALRLPAAWVEDGAPPLALSVELSPESPGRAALSLRLDAGSPPEALLTRSIATTAADCPELPALIAVIVARRLAELPREDWVRARTPPPPPRRALALSAGAELGLDRRHLAGRLALDALVGPASGFALAVGLAGTVARPEALGPGRVRFSALSASVGLARPVDLRAASLVPALFVAAGPVFARGLDLPASRRGAALVLRVGLSLGLATRAGLFVQTGLALAPVRARASDTASATATPEPLVRAWLSVGFALAREKP